MRTSETLEEGFSCLEVLVVAGMLLVVVGSAASLGRKFFMEAVVDYEVARIVSDLRWVQEHSRTRIYQGWERFRETAPTNTHAVWMHFFEDGYYVREYDGQELLEWRRTCFPGISISRPINKHEIRFKANGDTTYMMSVFVHYRKGTEDIGKYVIIDAAGRIRVDRRPP